MLTTSMKKTHLKPKSMMPKVKSKTCHHDILVAPDKFLFMHWLHATIRNPNATAIKDTMMVKRLSFTVL